MRERALFFERSQKQGIRFSRFIAQPFSTLTTSSSSTSSFKNTQPPKGVHAHRPEPTRGFKLQQTMIRIKDPERSLAFYTGVLGMRLSATLAFEAQRFSLYFLEFGETALPADEGDRLEDVFSRPSFLELTHNHGERERERERDLF